MQRGGSRARLELLAHESVGAGSLPDHEDAAAVDRALGRAEARDIVVTLLAGLETQLGASFDDGAELMAAGGLYAELYELQAHAYR